jgi:hypothetical protein
MPVATILNGRCKNQSFSSGLGSPLYPPRPESCPRLAAIRMLFRNKLPGPYSAVGVLMKAFGTVLTSALLVAGCTQVIDQVTTPPIHRTLGRFSSSWPQNRRAIRRWRCSRQVVAFCRPLRGSSTISSSRRCADRTSCTALHAFWAHTRATRSDHLASKRLGPRLAQALRAGR